MQSKYQYMREIKKRFDRLLMLVPKGATFSIVGAFFLYAGAKGWIGEAEMTFIAAVLSALGLGANMYVNNIYKRNGNKK